MMEGLENRTAYQERARVQDFRGRYQKFRKEVIVAEGRVPALTATLTHIKYGTLKGVVAASLNSKHSVVHSQVGTGV